MRYIGTRDYWLSDPIGICYECGDDLEEEEVAYEHGDDMWCAICSAEALPCCPVCEEPQRDTSYLCDHLVEDHDYSDYRAHQVIDEPYALALFEDTKEVTQ